MSNPILHIDTNEYLLINPFAPATNKTTAVTSLYSPEYSSLGVDWSHSDNTVGHPYSILANSGEMVKGASSAADEVAAINTGAAKTFFFEVSNLALNETVKIYFRKQSADTDASNTPASGFNCVTVFLKNLNDTDFQTRAGYITDGALTATAAFAEHHPGLDPTLRIGVLIEDNGQIITVSIAGTAIDFDIGSNIYPLQTYLGIELLSTGTAKIHNLRAW